MVRKKRRKSNSTVFWKCTNCGHVYQHRQAPELCVVCGSRKKFKKINKKEDMKMEDLEIPKRKKKYRRIFKKGFTRKYKKFQKR